MTGLVADDGITECIPEPDIVLVASECIDAQTAPCESKGSGTKTLVELLIDDVRGWTGTVLARIEYHGEICKGEVVIQDVVNVGCGGRRRLIQGEERNTNATF
ncbi:MAG: hypothetical protein V9G19_12530 [Tetrasphaera sp.]